MSAYKLTVTLKSLQYRTVPLDFRTGTTGVEPHTTVCTGSIKPSFRRSRSASIFKRISKSTGRDLWKRNLASGLTKFCAWSPTSLPRPGAKRSWKWSRKLVTNTDGFCTIHTNDALYSLGVMQQCTKLGKCFNPRTAEKRECAAANDDQIQLVQEDFEGIGNAYRLWFRKRIAPSGSFRLSIVKKRRAVLLPNAWSDNGIFTNLSRTPFTARGYSHEQLHTPQAAFPKTHCPQKTLRTKCKSCKSYKRNVHWVRRVRIYLMLNASLI